MKISVEIPKQPYQGTIFDCDGTLVDTMPAHHKAWRMALKDHGAGFDFDVVMFQEFAGVGHEDLVSQLNERFGTQLQPRETALRKDHYYTEMVDQMKPLEPLASYARELSKQGCLISVASGGGDVLVRRTLRAAGLLELFEDRCIVTQSDVSRSKPDPEIFLLAAERMGVAPENCVVFEDSALGMQGARDAGMALIEVPVTAR